MATGENLLKQLSERPDILQYRLEHWQGSFADYLDKVKADPKVSRTAYQRLYDMIMEDGMTPVDGSRDLIRYHFFDSPHNGGEDAVFGLTRPLMELANVFKSAAMKYGTERRVLLLHGPVGSSKSTIARLLKRGGASVTAARRGNPYPRSLHGENRVFVRDRRNSHSSGMPQSLRKARLHESGALSCRPIQAEPCQACIGGIGDVIVTIAECVRPKRR